MELKPTKEEVIMFAGRMRGLGIMKPQGYGEIEHSKVWQLLTEFLNRRPEPATQADWVMAEVERLRPHYQSQSAHDGDKSDGVLHLTLERRGEHLRIYSDQCPNLIMSGNRPEKVLAGLWPSLLGLEDYGVQVFTAAPPPPAQEGGGHLPTYGKLSWGELGRDVSEATCGTRSDYAFDPRYYPGHQCPKINFNSLSRIVDKYRLASPGSSPARPEPVNEQTVAELIRTLEQIVEEKCDYMRINNLGDPETQHTVKQARAALSAARGAKADGGA